MPKETYFDAKRDLLLCQKRPKSTTHRMAAGLAVVFIAALSLLCGANLLHEFVKHARATPARAGRVHALPPECRAREATTFLGL